MIIKTNRMTKIFSIFLLLVFCTKICRAQPFTLNKKIAPTELTLLNYTDKKDTTWNGKISVITVEQNKDTAYYFVKGLSMYQPIYFGVDAKNSAQKITINLCKDSWKKIERTGVTNNKGSYKTQFKTEGSFGIMIVSKAPLTTYNIRVWVGKEAKDVGVKSPFKTK
jgi:hypothetical protein